MGTNDANVALYHLELSTLAADTLQVVRFSGREEISRIFEFEIHLLSEDPDLDFADVLNKPATLTLARYGETVKIHGLIADFQQGNRTADWIAYRAVLVPRIWTLSLNYQSRIFQNKTVQDVVTEVLKDASFATKDFRFALKGTYKPREYCTQYRETDLAFISRLLESEGIYFFFEHDDDQDTLVMTDDRSEDPMIDGDSILAYKPGAALVPKDEPETVRELVCREKIVTGKVVLKDYNYRTPEVNLQGDSQLNKNLPGVYYEYGQHFKDVTQGKALAKVRNEEIECLRKVLVGKSNCVALRSGYKFSLTDHFRSDLNDDYLLTSVIHTGSQAAGFAASMAGGEGPTYENEFVGIPASVQYRPQRITPEPRVAGVMTAKVETAGGDYAYLDEEGRYRVKMPFDLSGTGSGKASRAIRLAQPYSGAGYGMHFPVHAGAEMIWACVDGNVDRPLGLSSTPNPSRNSPVVAKNKSQNIIRTAAGNELLMDDKIGESVVSLKTTDAHTVLLDDKDDKVEIISTQKHVVTMDDKNQNITIKTTNGHLVVLDDKNTKIVVQSTNGHRLIIDDGAKSITVADGQDENKIVMDIGNKQISLFTKDGGIDLKAPNGTIDVKAKAINIESSGDTSVKAANLKEEAKGDMTLDAKKGVTATASMDVKMKGMNVEVKGDMGVKVEGGMNLELKAGMQAKVSGMMTEVSGSAMTKVAGGLVMIN